MQAPSLLKVVHGSASNSSVNLVILSMRGDLLTVAFVA
jgi:hypothetical protein